jgi:hypothetical protein
VRANFIRPRDSGGGGPPRRGGGGGAGLNAARKLPSCVDIRLARFLSNKRSSSAAVMRLQRQQSSASGAPSTTVRSLRELQWSPSPASRGRMVRALVLATHPRPRLADQSHEFTSPQRNEGRRSAGRRDCLVGPRHAADVAIHLRFGRSRASSGTRSPLGAPPRLWPRFLGLGFSTSGQVSWDAAVRGRYPLFPVPVQRMHPAHRP